MSSSASAPEFALSPCRVPATPLDLTTSTRLARRMGTRNGYCYRNSINAMPYVPDASYVEGIVVFDSLESPPCAHGWLERVDGRIVDPTPVFCARRRTPATYFPVLRWTAEELHSTLHRLWTPAGVRLPLLAMLLRRARDTDAVREALLAASSHIAALCAEQLGVPLRIVGTEAEFVDVWIDACWTSPSSVENGEPGGGRRRTA